MIRIGVLAARDSWYAKDLIRAAEQSSCATTVELLSFAELQVELGAKRGLQVRTESVNAGNGRADRVVPQADQLTATKQLNRLNVDCIGDLDAIMVRTMPLGSLEQVIFRMDCLHALEAAGRPVINPPRTLEVAIDKWLTLHRLHLAGVPVPPTIACQSRDAAVAACEQLGSDVLIKPIFGGEGRGILRVQGTDMAWRACGTVSQLGQVLYVQQYLDHLGYDIRVLIIGSKMHCIKRICSPGAWRANLSQGSRAEPHELTDEQRELATVAAQSVGGSVLGIDILPLRSGGHVVLEVNAVPGWKGLSRALQIDVAGEVIDHVASVIAQSKSSLDRCGASSGVRFPN